MQTDMKFQPSRPEVWGGVECSITRIGEQYRDQLAETGHYDRVDDLIAIADLQVKALRYPILWERHQPSKDTDINWEWAENRLSFLREKNIAPIVGLTHHGSGPKYTDLLDPDYPTLLADYASKVAAKFPWVDYYCPVNEPLTTARFSGLYGIWYPHEKNDLSFFTMLIHEVKATVLSMAAIRLINPNAKLVQTEDITKVHSTHVLNYQAEFENDRRWLTFDLLCGRVNPTHPLWNYLMWVGIQEKDLQFFSENPCPPDIVGLNYYVTSERFLDHRIERYPEALHGGNGRHRYVDVEAVRVLKLDGLETLLMDTWDRYHLPMALTEVHLNCSREEQLRWFNEIWNICADVAAKGAYVKGVTAWALLGAFDWDSLVTLQRGHYESGVFDLKNNSLRKTALTDLVRALATHSEWNHPVLQANGWWHQSERFIHETALLSGRTRSRPQPRANLLILGRDRSLGQAFCRMCYDRRIDYVSVDEQTIVNDGYDVIVEAIERTQPWAIVNATSYSAIRYQGYGDELCVQLNRDIPAHLATICNAKGIQLLTFSSPVVFDGQKKTPYGETDTTSPLNDLGTARAEGERIVQLNYAHALIVRISTAFGPWNSRNCVQSILRHLDRKQTIKAFHNSVFTPGYLPDIVQAALDLLIDREQGIWHLANRTVLSWEDFAKEIARRGGYSASLIEPVSRATVNFSANSGLQSYKGLLLPDLDNVFTRYFATL